MALQKFQIGIRTPSEKIVQAFDLCINGDDVYVNYGNCRVPEAHGSYHASGQNHIKIGGQYVYWNGGPSGKWEPMKQVLRRPAEVTECAEFFNLGWPVSWLDEVLPLLQGPPALIVDTHNLSPAAVVLLTVSVVGSAAANRTNILGFPLLTLQHFGTAPRVEVVASLVDKEPMKPRLRERSTRRTKTGHQGGGCTVIEVKDGKAFCKQCGELVPVKGKPGDVSRADLS